MRTLNEPFMDFLFPDLQSFSDSEREEAFRRAKRIPFDIFELIAMAIGSMIVAAFASYGVEGTSFGERLSKGLGNFFSILGLLVIVLGPFFVRRTRRGLRAELEQQRARNNNVKE